MDGSAELLQLAHLLRVGAKAARDIASMRKHDAAEIVALAGQAETMAEEVEAIVKRAQDRVQDDAH